MTTDQARQAKRDAKQAYDIYVQLTQAAYRAIPKGAIGTIDYQNPLTKHAIAAYEACGQCQRLAYENWVHATQVFSWALSQKR